MGAAGPGLEPFVTDRPFAMLELAMIVREDRPVVVGVDGSTSALAATRWAARDALRLRVPLRLVHAFTVGGVDYLSRQLSVLQLRDHGELRLRVASVAATQAAPGLMIETAVRQGDRRVVLLDESKRATLVVLGSRGLGGVSRLIMGSVGLTLAVHGTSPVIVVRGPARERGPVVVGVDGWPSCAAAVRFAFTEAARHGTGLTAVRTWRALATADPIAVHEEERVALIRQLAEPAEDFPQVPVEHVVVRGRPGRTLLDYGKHARMIVVGTRGRTGFAGLLLGSTSQAVVQHGTCPVAVVRCEDPLDPAANAAHLPATDVEPTPH
jgi:nucleotide-binding universal stress UspA family protein